MRKRTWISSVLATCTTVLLLPLGVALLPANAQGYHNGGPSVNLNIRWGPGTWGRYCRSDGYGHYWGRDRRYDGACWDNRHYSRDYHRDRWGRW